MLVHYPEHFHFWENKKVASLYYTIALVRFAASLVAVFVPIYLWELGYEFWQIMGYFFLESAYFVVFAFLLVPLVRRLTDRSLLFLSIPFFILTFLGLAELDTTPYLFTILPAVASLHLFFFQTGYDWDFARAADNKHLGKEIGLRFMIASLVALLAPTLGGIFIEELGFHSTFIAAAFVLVLALVPLFFFPAKTVSMDFRAANVWKLASSLKTVPYTLSAMGHAADWVVGVVVWRIFLYLFVGDIERFGIIMSATLFVGALVNFWAGKVVDAGNRANVVTTSSFLVSIAWFLRVFITTVAQAVGLHLLVHIVYPALLVGWSRQFYELAKSAPDPLAFILGREVVYHFFRTVFFAVLMVLSINLSQDAFFTVAFICASVLTLFHTFSNRQDMRAMVKQLA